MDPGTADFRLLSRQAVNAFCQLRERHRFNRGLIAWMGFSQIAVPYSAGERMNGESKYVLSKRLRLALDGLLSFSILPLRAAAVSGFLMSLAALAYAMWLVMEVLIGIHWMSGIPTLAVGIMFFGGLQLMFLGIIGEYVGRIYEESKHRPLYFVKATLGQPQK